MYCEKQLSDKLETTEQNIRTSNFLKPRLHNRVIITNELGEVISDDTNEVLLQGSLLTLSKLFGINQPFKFPSINDILGVNADESTTSFDGPRREDVIYYFTAGLDGCSETYGNIHTVKTYHNGSKNMIPFRRVPISKDISEQEQQKYAIKKEINGYYEYYVKKFESEPIFKCEYKDTGVPLSSDILNEDLPPEREEQIINYVLANLKINKLELREYFMQIGGGIEKCRVNTISLCQGYIEYDEHGVARVKGIRPITQYNFNNEPMDNEEKELHIKYMVYV